MAQNEKCEMKMEPDTGEYESISYRLFFGTNSDTANASSCQPCKNVYAGGFDLQSMGGTVIACKSNREFHKFGQFMCAEDDTVTSKWALHFALQSVIVNCEICGIKEYVFREVKLNLIDVGCRCCVRRRVKSDFSPDLHFYFSFFLIFIFSLPTWIDVGELQLACDAPCWVSHVNRLCVAHNKSC